MKVVVEVVPQATRAYYLSLKKKNKKKPSVLVFPSNRELHFLSLNKKSMIFSIQTNKAVIEALITSFCTLYHRSKLLS